MALDPNFIRSQELKLPYPEHDFSGQTIIVTGANVGLGLEAARHFVRLNAEKVILAVRSVAKGEAAKADIEASTKRLGVVDVYELDLGSYASVKSFVSRVSDLPRVDAIVENAGIAMEKFVMAEDCESTITVNVVSTMLLAIMMLPILRRSAEKFHIVPRIAIVSSGNHHTTKFPDWKAEDTFAVLNDEQRGDMSRRYPDSKLLEILAVREMVHHIHSEPKVAINLIDPGLCESQLARNMTGERAARIKNLREKFARTTEEGSRTLVHGATVGWESHGHYLNDCTINDEGLSEFVRSTEGEQAQKKMWKELVEKLKTIQPDIISCL